MKFENVRFVSSVFVLVSVAIGNGVIIKFPDVLGRFAPVLALFFYYWYSLFGAWMSRNRRAVFNEQNVMLTYQPRALTKGHLFAPDPPTPVPGSKADTGERKGCISSAFLAAREQHYKDEFILAQKMSNEKDEMMKFKKVESLRIEFEDLENSDISESTSSLDDRKKTESDGKGKSKKSKKKKKSETMRL